ncbi:hypothetical protein A4S05_36040 [Nostoc sp. KVJ20]|uniref:M4 family metallopeptidase n=1 Tax=Nostoc sp. KVJ20 TaxID=457944 RepID=UPI00086F5A63|nr:M4 family metallopeptidase [Nostoc sp. KVJ20]ODG99861.1 hypothetical protein A4S05_36040 [Nostoc sp. KVJ20]
MDNGLRTFVFQASLDPVVTSLRSEVLAAEPQRGDGASDLSALDAENVAQRYVKSALASSELPNFTVTEVNGQTSEFKSLGVENIPFTNTKTVKLRQYYRKIPVYGSLITVELEQDNELVSLNSALGDPVNVDAIASISPSQAIQVVREAAGYGKQHLDAMPRLNYYYDRDAHRWRLVYIIEDVLKLDTDNVKEAHPLPEVMDYVINAHSGELISELPRTQTVNEETFTDTEKDGLGKTRQISGSQQEGVKFLRNQVNNVHTHDFEFSDSRFQSSRLPGKYVQNPPAPWDGGAISAHANSEEVVRFLKNVLMRNGLDNQGGKIVSSVNCLFSGESVGREWRNAARFRGQMIYGQRMVGGQLVSYAVALDVVAHELLHGLTENTARLEYQFESGALNESYSDIFGIIISNFNESNIDKWNWQMGEDLSNTGIPLRDLSNPRSHSQPDHMRNYLHTTIDNDNGGVHTNSGIHNKAAFNILTAKDSNSNYLFDAISVTRMFYLALSQDLSRTSGFSDSRRAIEKWARSLFRNDPSQNEKLQAIAKAFDDVGIN